MDNQQAFGLFPDMGWTGDTEQKIDGVCMGSGKNETLYCKGRRGPCLNLLFKITRPTTWATRDLSLSSSQNKYQ